MAIDNTGISSLETGAPDIKYTGDEGPKSPDQELMAQADPMLVEEYKKYVFEMEEMGQQPMSFKQFLEQIMSSSQAGGRGGIQMASAADPMLQEEYDKYVFEMEEQGLQPMSLEEFRQQAVAGMATGGRAGYKDGYSVQGGVKNYLGDQETVSDVPIKWQSGPDKPKTELAYITKSEKDLLLKKDIHGSLKDGPNVGPGGLMSLDSWGDIGGGGKAGVDVSPQEDRGGPDPNPQHSFSGIGPTESPADFKARTIKEEQILRNAEKQQADRLGYKYEDPFEDKGKTKKVDILKKTNALMGPQAWYRWAQGLPGAKTSLLRQRKKYKEYLEKYYGPDYNLDWFDEEDIGDYDLYKRLVGMERPIAESGMTPGMTYAEFLASGAASKSGVGNFNLLARGNLGNLKDLKKPDNIIDPKTGLLMTDARWEQIKRDSGQGASSYDRGPSAEGIASTLPLWQQQGFNSYADWLAAQGTGQTEEEEETPATNQQATLTGLGGIDQGHLDILKNIYGGTLPAMFAADGGRIGYAGGGIADLRQGYFLGKLVKKITKPVKKAAKSATKLLKNPMIRTALMAGIGWKGPNILKGLGLGEGTWGSGLSALGSSIKKNPFPWIAGASALGGLYTGMTQDDDEEEAYKKWLADKKAADEYWIPRFDESNFRRITSAQGGRIGYAGGGNGKDDSMVGISMSIEERWERIKKMLQQLEDIRSGKTTDPKYDPEDKAMGGRIGYKKGGNDEELSHREAALSAMYRPKAQEGGLMDLGGMEKDYRNEGGFVPIGGQERADDVPARLSKNEFVFTADAVRNAGGGDIDKGAEIMENIMENLEKGGKVSEESQGLEGARNMFATAQRLEGVL